MTSANIKYLRNYSGLNQTAFGQLFNSTRGMIDSYERGTAKPSTEFIKALASHYKISMEVLTGKDLRLNPGLMYSGAPASDIKSIATDDLLKSKEELIRELKSRIKYLENQNEQLLASLAKAKR